MTSEQIASLVRQILLFGGGFVVAKGWLDQESMLAIAGAVAAAVASYFAFRSRTKAAIVASAAAKVDVPASSQIEAGVDKIVTPK